MIYAATMIHTAVIDTSAIDTPVATMSHYRAMGAGTTSPIYAPGANDRTRLRGCECKEASEQGSTENEAFHNRLPKSQ
jgi:hypothetical protein